MFSKNIGTGRRGMKLAMERLEEKTLLAGDVHVTVNRGDLHITGDFADNGVEVVATNDPGEYLVRGVDRGGAPTTINGSPNEIVRGVDDDVHVDLRGGDNGIELAGVEDDGEDLELLVPDDLNITHRSGRMDVLTNLVRVGGDLSIDTRGGDDAVDLRSTSIHGDAEIDTRRGDDDVQLELVEVGDDLEIDLGSHDDTLLLQSVDVDDDATFKLGRGENSVTVENALIGDDFRITGGHSPNGDTIRVRDTIVDDEIRIFAHAGDDTVCMLNVEARDLHVHMGRGNDRLDLESVFIDRRTRLNGDGGMDTLGRGDDNLLNGLRVRTFEVLDDFLNCFDDDGNGTEPTGNETT